MKQYAKELIIGIIVIFIIGYLIGVFASAEFNIKLWQNEVRGGIAAFIGIIIIYYSIIIANK